jgi:putative tricarboxylic transport membrane protein
MRRGELCMSGGFLVVGLYAITESIRMQYYVDGGPGPGFFPLWLGVIVVGCSALIMFRTLRGSDESPPRPFLPPRGALLRCAATLAALCFFAFSANRVGYKLSMFLVLFFLTTVVTKAGWKTALVTAVVGSLGSFYFFGVLLEVYLPPSSVSILTNLGL